MDPRGQLDLSDVLHEPEVAVVDGHRHGLLMLLRCGRRALAGPGLDRPTQGRQGEEQRPENTRVQIRSHGNLLVKGCQLPSTLWTRRHEKSSRGDLYGVRRSEKVTVPSGEGAAGDSVGVDTA